jgi:glycosyltransferase involved in cell wall biosynthesis
VNGRTRIGMFAERPGAQRITLASPYAEGAMLAIARAASARDLLEGFLTTLYWGDDRKSRLFVRSLVRRRLRGVPARLVWQGARPTELAYLTSKRFGYGRITASLMYRTQEHFDYAVAREVRRRQTDVIVGVNGGAQKTFEVARGQGIRTILHVVNSHPRVHNALLSKAGAPAESHEYVPLRAAERVDAELQLADLVLVPSAFVANQLLSEGISPERLSVMRYGVDPGLFVATPRPCVRARSLRCLYVGMISWGKGIRVLIDAARMLSGFATFKLIGPLVSPEVLEKLPPNVVVSKTVPHRWLRDEYARADVFVLPSIDDSFGLVTLEALSSGLPVVVSSSAGTSEMITHGRDGLVVPSGSATALATALQDIADPHLRAELGSAGRALVERGNSWEEYGARVLATLDSLRPAA